MFIPGAGVRLHLGSFEQTPCVGLPGAHILLQEIHRRSGFQQTVVTSRHSSLFLHESTTPVTAHASTAVYIITYTVNDNWGRQWSCLQVKLPVAVSITTKHKVPPWRDITLLACRVLPPGEWRCAVDCYRRRQTTTTDDDRRTSSKTILTLYTMCRWVGGPVIRKLLILTCKYFYFCKHVVTLNFISLLWLLLERSLSYSIAQAYRNLCGITCT